MSKNRFVQRAMFCILVGLSVVPLNTLVAQSLAVGVKGGISLPELRGGNSEQTQGYTSRLGPGFGVLVSSEIVGPLALQVEVLYTGQGGKKSGLQPIPSGTLPDGTVPPGTTLYASYKNETALNYLEIPLLAKVNLNIGVPLGLSSVYVDVGPYIGILLNATTTTSGVSAIYVDKSGTPLVVPPTYQQLPPVDFGASTDVKGDIKTLNAGIAGGVGFGASFGPGAIVFDVRGSYGFTDIQKDPSNGKNNTGALVLTLGYTLSL